MEQGSVDTSFQKGGQGRLLANYRPVTALKAVTFTEKIDTHLYDKLSAYRKTHSCEIKLTRLMEDWRKAMDNEECVAVLSTDMSKAFEKLDLR